MEELFDLDKSLCVKCGACVRDCAFRVLRTSEDGYPYIPENSKCMKCQHCFAICPKGAIKFDGKKPEDSIRVDNLALPKADEVENWLKTRRSCRHFRKEDVNREKLERILETLGNVPTGCNARSLTFTCFPDRASMDSFRSSFIRTIEKHREGTKLLPRWLAAPAIRMRRGSEDMFFRGASGLLIISSDETNPEVTTPNEDVAAAITYFEILAAANGFATCWCGFLKLVQKEIPEILEETAGIKRSTPFYAMLFGLPAVKYRRSVQRESYAKTIYR